MSNTISNVTENESKLLNKHLIESTPVDCEETEEQISSDDDPDEYDEDEEEEDEYGDTYEAYGYQANESFSSKDLDNRSKRSRRSLYEMYHKVEFIQVNCNSIIGDLFKKKFGSGGKGSCIRVLVDLKPIENNKSKEPMQEEKWMTPIEFESYCGKGNCRDWKRTIKCGGQSLGTLLDSKILVCHAVSCSCAACNKNETLVGPIRPFMRYRRRKRDEIVAQNAFKKFLSLKPPTLLQESLQKIQNNANSSNADKSSKLSGLNLISPQASSFIGNQSDSANTSPINDTHEIEPSLSIKSQKDFAACLKEFEEDEEKKWLLLEQESNKLVAQAHSLQQLIHRTQKQSELNRQILIKKFFKNSE